MRSRRIQTLATPSPAAKKPAPMLRLRPHTGLARTMAPSSVAAALAARTAGCVKKTMMHTPCRLRLTNRWYFHLTLRRRFTLIIPASDAFAVTFTFRDYCQSPPTPTTIPSAFAEGSTLQHIYVSNPTWYSLVGLRRLHNVERSESNALRASEETRVQRAAK